MRPNQLSRHKYQALLLALLLLLVAYPALRGPAGSPVLARSLLSAVFFAGGWVTCADRRLCLPGAVLAAPAVAGVWTSHVVPDLPRPAVAVAFHLWAAVFLAVVVVVTLRAVHREKRVSADAVCGAFCGYLVAGLAFGHLYCAIESLDPGSFRGDGTSAAQLADEDHRHFLLTYFSLVTLTTVGYGDITPGSDAARGVAVVEAVAGQFYIAVLVAELIGKRVSQALAPEAADGR